MSYNTTKLFKSFIVIPLLLTSVSMTSLTDSVQKYVEAQASINTKEIQNSEVVQLQLEREETAAKIDMYFAERKMPLSGYGMKMVLEAEKNDLDPYLIPAMAVRESTGGKFACYRFPENAWGWNSCKAGLGGTTDKAIELIAQHLGGNHKNTKKYYDGKDVKEILQTYNPPKIVAEYANQVMKIMATIESIQITSE